MCGNNKKLQDFHTKLSVVYFGDFILYILLPQRIYITKLNEEKKLTKEKNKRERKCSQQRIEYSTHTCVIRLFLTWFAMWADENSFFIRSIFKYLSIHCIKKKLASAIVTTYTHTQTKISVHKLYDALGSLFNEYLIDYDRSQRLWFWKSRRFAKMFKGCFGWFTTNGNYNLNIWIEI